MDDSSSKKNKENAITTGVYEHAVTSSSRARAESFRKYGNALCAGDDSTAIAHGDNAVAASIGDGGVAIATGEYSWAIAGFGGVAKAGRFGTITIYGFDTKKHRFVAYSGHVGEDGIEANVFYRIRDGRFIECDIIGRICD